MLGQQELAGPPEPRRNAPNIMGFLQQNPEIFGSLLGAAFEGIVGGDVGIGAEQGLMGASRVIQSRRQREALELKRQQVGLMKAQKQQERAQKQENVLRKEFTNRTKKFDEVIAANKKIEGSLTRATAAGDLAGIFSFMKVLDPGSTVREGEFANAQNSAGIPDRIRNLYNQALEGQRLNPVQREDFLRTSRQLFESEKEVFDTTRQDFAQLASRQGLDVRNVVGERQVKVTPIEELLQKTKQKEARKEDRKVKRRVVSLKDL